MQLVCAFFNMNICNDVITTHVFLAYDANFWKALETWQGSKRKGWNAAVKLKTENKSVAI